MNKGEAVQSLSAMLGPLDPEQSRWLHKRVQLRSYSTSYALVHEGQHPRTLFLLLEGRVRISKLRPDRRQEVIAYTQPLALLAHAAALGGRRHPTTIAAAEPSRCLLLPLKLLEPDDDPISRSMAWGLLQATVRGMNAQLRAVNARLASMASHRELVDSMACDLGAWALPDPP